MSCCHSLRHLVQEGTLGTYLVKNVAPNTYIKDLQWLLYELGFDQELKWAQYGADGYYGDALTAAVQRFAQVNGIPQSGTKVTKQMALLMLDLHDQLDEMQELDSHLPNIETVCYKGSPNKVTVAALQTLLNALGYGKQLLWTKYRNDGDYGNATSTALAAYMADQGLTGSSTKLTTPVAKSIIAKRAVYYGAHWRTNTAKPTESQQELMVYSGSEFQGKKVIADRLFIPMLEKINAYAVTNKVKIHVTSSFRTNANVSGAIVKPAQKSNHMVGHAIDMNIAFPTGFANSTYLRKANEGKWNPHVKGFINAIRSDRDLRWGGDFSAEDPVHIDDGLNVRDAALWESRFDATQQEYKEKGGSL